MVEGEKTEKVAQHIFEEYENVLKVTILMNMLYQCWEHRCCKLNGATPILSFQITNRNQSISTYGTKLFVNGRM